MPDNVLNIPGQWFSVIAGTIALLGGALTFAIRHRMRVHSGSSGHRPDHEQGETERVSPDGYIDSFANVVSEAGGGLPFIAKVIIGVTVVCYFTYLILFWQPR